MVGKRPNGAGRGSQLWKLSGLGVEFASQVVAGLLLGLFIDHQFGTRPRWILIGTVAGLLVGMSTMLRSAIKANKRALEETRKRQDEDPTPKTPTTPTRPED